MTRKASESPDRQSKGLDRVRMKCGGSHGSVRLAGSVPLSQPSEKICHSRSSSVYTPSPITAYIQVLVYIQLNERG